MLHKLREILPPKSCRKSGLDFVDKTMLKYCRRVLNVKGTTSNLVVYGEYGMSPPTPAPQPHPQPPPPQPPPPPPPPPPTPTPVCYTNRLYNTSGDTLANHVYEGLNKLSSTGLMTWVIRVNQLIVNYDIDITKLSSNFRTDCKTAVITQLMGYRYRDTPHIKDA